MASNYIDYSALKKRISIVDVLAHYIDEEDLVQHGDQSQLRLPCVLCDYQKSSLSISVEKNVFKCFHCKEQGNILDFVRAAEGLENVHEAGKILLERFPQKKRESQSKKKKTVKRKRRDKTATTPQEVSPKVKTTNTVLGFELKNIDPEHQAVAALGLPDEIIRRYGIGYYSGRGSLKDSLVAPVYRYNGELLAYLSFSIDREVVYPAREHFNPEADLYGLHVLQSASVASHLMIVSNPVDVYVCASYGVHAVATMGTIPSSSQVTELFEMLQFDSFTYLYSERQSDADVGHIVRVLQKGLAADMQPLEQYLEKI